MNRLVQITLVVMVASACIAESGYDIAGVFKKIPAPFGTITLTSSGDLKKVKDLFVPTRFEEGTYKVTVTRRGVNLYEIDDYGIYIQTRHCSEYGHGEDAMLKYTSSYGYSRGELIFLD